LLEKNIYGDEFELYSLELLGLLAMELMAGRYAEESMNILTSLSDLVQSNLQEDLPDHSSIGRLIATIAPVTWNLRQLSVCILQIRYLMLEYHAFVFSCIFTDLKMLTN
jgi:hypothetical protein